jgi:hypothetical protein
MSAKKLSTVTCHVITSYGNTAKNVIHAYHAGGERVVGLLEQRWNRALKESRSQLATGVAKNANVVQQMLHKYSLKGLTLTSGGAQDIVNQVVKFADASVLAVSANVDRFEDKTGAHLLSSLAQAALPGAVVLSSLASQIEQKSADLASKIAGDKVVVTVVKRARTAARKPRKAAAPTATAAAAEAATATA